LEPGKIATSYVGGKRNKKRPWKKVPFPSGDKAGVSLNILGGEKRGKGAGVKCCRKKGRPRRRV